MVSPQESGRVVLMRRGRAFPPLGAGLVPAFSEMYVQVGFEPQCRVRRRRACGHGFFDPDDFEGSGSLFPALSTWLTS